MGGRGEGVFLTQVGTGEICSGFVQVLVSSTWTVCSTLQVEQGAVSNSTQDATAGQETTSQGEHNQAFMSLCHQDAQCESAEVPK